MKKIALILLLTLTVSALCAVGVAHAETACETQICQLAQNNENVLDAKCVVYRRIAVIAIRTEQMFTKSAYDEYVAQLKEDVTSKFEVDSVFVTRNPKLMKEIDALSKLEGEEREKVVQRLIEEAMKRRPLRETVIPKVDFLK